MKSDDGMEIKFPAGWLSRSRFALFFFNVCV